MARRRLRPACRRKGTAEVALDRGGEVRDEILGGALGIAVLGSVLNGLYRSDVAAGLPGVNADVADQAQDSLPAALAIAGRLGESGDTVAAVARDAFAQGMTVACIASGAVLVLVASVLSVAYRGGATAVPAEEDVVEEDVVEMAPELAAAHS